MGVYIKGLKMPTTHEGQMVIRIDPDGKADVQWSGMVGGEYTNAVEVPDHGELGDMAELPTIEPPMTDGYVTTVSDLPPVEYAPVVRCKDCKYWRANTQFCGMFSGFGTSHRMPPNAFCSLAERSEE